MKWGTASFFANMKELLQNINPKTVQKLLDVKVEDIDFDDLIIGVDKLSIEDQKKIVYFVADNLYSFVDFHTNNDVERFLKNFRIATNEILKEINENDGKYLFEPHFYYKIEDSKKVFENKEKLLEYISTLTYSKTNDKPKIVEKVDCYEIDGKIIYKKDVVSMFPRHFRKQKIKKILI